MRGIFMRISLTESIENGFKKWSDRHRAAPAGGGAIAAVDADLGLPMITPSERPHRPWAVPGVGTAW